MKLQPLIDDIIKYSDEWMDDAYETHLGNLKEQHPQWAEGMHEWWALRLTILGVGLNEITLDQDIPDDEEPDEFGVHGDMSEPDHIIITIYPDYGS